MEQKQILTESQFEKYLCLICTSICEQPAKIPICNHSYCLDCLTKLCEVQLKEKNPQLNCPQCRQKFTKKDLVIDNQIKNEISMFSYNCKCGVSIKLHDYNKHQLECLIEQQNVEQALQKLKVKPEEVKQSVNRSTFKCPFCNEANLERKGLVEHVNKKHKGKTGVCPICAAQPYGDPNYQSQNLSSHLKMRHNYDIDTYTDYDLDDEAIYQQVLMKSYIDK